MATRETFRVDPVRYPVFCKQASMSMSDSGVYLLGIDETLSAYVSDTAGLIAELDGSSAIYEKDANRFVPDHVVYLDKSGRPCSWLVGRFWKDLAVEGAEFPGRSFLNIDRRHWVERSGAELFTSDYVRAPDGSNHRLSYADFHEENITEEHLAWIRAQYVPGGIEREDAGYVMSCPTVLDGKGVLVVDEVSNSGATLKIAVWLLSHALPEAKVRGCHFWKKLSAVRPVEADDGQMLNAPVWYDHHNQFGRGIGDLDADGSYWAAEYERNPTPVNLARKFGARTLSRRIDLSPGGADDRGTDRPTRQLKIEMRRMLEDYEAGRVLFQPPDCYDRARKKEAVLAQRLRLGRGDAPDLYSTVCEQLTSERTRL